MTTFTTFTATNATTLSTALADAVGGDRIELTAGDYGALSLKNLAFSSDETIVSAVPANPAAFSGLYIRDASHLVFDGILLDFTFGLGDAVWERPFEIIDSSYITIRNSVFDGSEIFSEIDGDSFGTGFGLTVNGSSFVVVENNEFFKFWKALAVSLSTDIIVRDNDVHTLRSDGFNFISVDGLLVEGNYLHDFKMMPSSNDHLDMIQCWTVLVEPSLRNVIMRGNFLDAGAGDWAQSLFMRNGIVDTGQGSFGEYAFQNILIENNVIYNAQVHGITVGETDGLVIRNNTLLYDGGVAGELPPGNSAPRINLSEVSLNVTAENNISESTWNWEILASQTGWTLINNLFVQHEEPSGENYYGDLFVNALVGAAELADLRAVAGGLIEFGGYGAAMTRADLPMIVGPYATAPQPPEPEVCETLLAEALALLDDLEIQLIFAQAALVTMTAERDAALAERNAALAAQVIAESSRAAAEASLGAALARLDEIHTISGG